MFERSLDIERLFDHHGCMHRTYVRRRRTVAIIAVALAAVLMSPLAAAAVRPGAVPAQAPAQRTIVVEPGETLWSIAQRARPGADPRETIAWIQAANGVDAGSLQAGQSLTVPAA
jgi:Tfp pilus assembly protein FimV